MSFRYSDGTLIDFFSLSLSLSQFLSLTSFRRLLCDQEEHFDECNSNFEIVFEFAEDISSGFSFIFFVIRFFGCQHIAEVVGVRFQTFKSCELKVVEMGEVVGAIGQSKWKVGPVGSMIGRFWVFGLMGFFSPACKNAEMARGVYNGLSQFPLQFFLIDRPLI